MNLLTNYARFLKFLAAFAVGFVCASLLFVVVILPADAESKFEWGTHVGLAQGYSRAASIIEKEYGVYEGQTPCKTIFTVKMTRVISIEVNGVKTIRVANY